MTLADLIRRFRALSNDRVEPYFSSDEDLTDWFNDAQKQACVRGRLLRDDSTPAVCQIALMPGQQVYTLHPNLYEIISLRITSGLSGFTRTMVLKSREWLDKHMYQWRDKTEATCFAVQDENTIRIVGAINDGDVLKLEVYRLPMAPMVLMTDSPEIHRFSHEYLIEWVLHRAFSVPDSELFDSQRAALAEAAFTRYFGIMPDSDMRRITREDVQHHNEAILP